MKPGRRSTEAVGPRVPTRGSPLTEEVAELRRTGLDESPDGRLHLRDLGRTWRNWFADLALILVDAVIARDVQALEAADELLGAVHRAVAIASREHTDGAQLHSCRSWAQLTSDHLRSALDRVAPTAAATRFRGTRREMFLHVVAERPGVNSREIRDLINEREAAADGPSRRLKLMDEGQLSRLGAGLRAESYVIAERGPHGLSWELTPRGEEVLGHLSEVGRPMSNFRMVVTTPGVSDGEIVSLIRETPPQSIWFVGARNRVKYRWIRRVPGTDKELEMAGRPPVDQVIKELTGERRDVPSCFTVEGRLYARV
jgi:hypothetical protein